MCAEDEDDFGVSVSDADDGDGAAAAAPAARKLDRNTAFKGGKSPTLAPQAGPKVKAGAAAQSNANGKASRGRGEASQSPAAPATKKAKVCPCMIYTGATVHMSSCNATQLCLCAAERGASFITCLQHGRKRCHVLA